VDDDIDEYFQQAGCWAVAVIGLFQAAAMTTNTALPANTGPI
jgi:hypothetical protein